MSDETLPIATYLLDEIVPSIVDLAELKVVLTVARFSARDGSPAVSLAAILTPSVVRSIAADPSPKPGERRVLEAVDRAVANGALLAFRRSSPDGAHRFLMTATPAHRSLWERLNHDAGAAGQVGVGERETVEIERPNIFSFYERYIGPLTPIVAEQLRAAEREYPREWIEAAVLEAVTYNRRNWRYVETILGRWEESGSPHGITGRRA